jgi:acyl-homoserine-lactone acylase
MRMSGRVRATIGAAAVVAVLGVACSSDDGATGGAAPPGTGGGGSTSGTTIVATPFDGTYEATIVRTAEGIPHITGVNIESAIYGQGYASGQDYACTLADQMLKVQGRRAEALGPGEADANINSDFAWRTIGIDELARADWADQPDDVKAQMEAFTAGWNRHLADVGADAVTGWCAGAEWLTPITAEDLYSYARSIALNASSTQVARYLGNVVPPAPLTDAPEVIGTPTSWGGTPGTPVSAAAASDFAAGLEPFASAPSMASNGWAIGTDRSTGGGGMLVANPHFPWEGELRFWESHLIVPGEVNIYGAQLEGLPGVGIGFTDEFAWTHTVSAGNRFTAYTLELAPGTPTSYRYDDEIKPMTSRDETVKVRRDDGTVDEVTRTLWFSEYGPILDFPGVGWTESTTVTYRDANIDNDEFIQQYLAMDRAQSFDEFQEAHATHQGVPLFNTIAVSRDGRAWYADTSATPNLSDEALAAYEAALAAPGFTSIAASSGAVLLDGSDSIYQWVDDPGARDPGLVPYTEMPQMERSDYVFNANDSFWVANAEELLEGDYSPLHGRQDTPRSPRTRENATILADTSASGGAGDDGTFDVTELRDLALANRGFPTGASRRASCARRWSSVAVPRPSSRCPSCSAATVRWRCRPNRSTSPQRAPCSTSGTGATTSTAEARWCGASSSAATRTPTC